MKKSRIFILFAALLAFSGLTVMAGGCGPVVYQHPAVGYFTGLSGSHTANFWKFGQGNAAANTGGTQQTGDVDNGGYSHTNWLNAFAPGEYYLFGDWNNVAIDGCTNTGTDRMVVAVSDRSNEGAATHAGTFALASVTFAGTYNFDNATTNGPILTQIAVPVPTVSATSNAGGGVHNITLTWTDVANARGAFDSNPGADMVSYQAYFATGAEPTTSAIGSWTAIGSTVAQGVQTVTFAMNDTDINNTAWVTLAVVFNDGSPDPFRSQFVSAHTNAIGPLAADDVLGASGASLDSANDKVKVDWNSLSEVGVSGFNVYWSETETGSYNLANGNMIAPKGAGAGAAYNFDFNKPTVSGNHIYVKVEAVKTGESEFTDPMAVSISIRPIRDTRPKDLSPTDKLKDRSLRTR